eukprot:TRINITY_DN12253_c0_g1_i2.p1 TRINITY_DN12253_c0_g1~~TRINITY_DN12253_c0_g1_i2.p1  ORF type:complete len:105 (-),score=17.88 TRINITY_DN12253_c0_g1_i2:260-574(-)
MSSSLRACSFNIVIIFIVIILVIVIRERGAAELQLTLDQLVVDSILSHELVVCAFLNNVSLADYQHLISIANSRQPMRNHQHRSANHGSIYRLLNKMFALCVQS